MPKFTYNYIDISGRGLAAKHLLAYVGAPEEDYEVKSLGWRHPITHDAPGYAENHLLRKWPSDKKSWSDNNPFILLPYITTEDGDVISSNAGVMTWLGLRYGVVTGMEAGKFDHRILAGLEMAQELREGFVNVFLFGTQMGKEGEEGKVDYEAARRLILKYGDKSKPSQIGPWGKLATFERQLQLQLRKGKSTASNSKFLFTEDRPSIVDFTLFSTLSIMRKWHSKLLEGYEELERWYQAMLVNPGLRERVEAEREEPFFGAAENFEALGSDCYIWGVTGVMEPMF